MTDLSAADSAALSRLPHPCALDLYCGAGARRGQLSRTRIVKRRRGKNVCLVEMLGQDELHAALERAGVLVSVARSLGGLLDVLVGWGVPMRVSAFVAERA